MKAPVSHFYSCFQLDRSPRHPRSTSSSPTRQDRLDVEVELRGSALAGAEQLVVNGPGITGEVDKGGAKVDEKASRSFSPNAALATSSRSPSNRSMTPRRNGHPPSTEW